MNSGWPERRLGDVLEIKHGFAFLGRYFSDAGTHIILTPGNFFDDGGFKTKVNEKWYCGPINSDYILSAGDLLIAMTEQAEGLLGSSAIVPRSNLYLHNQRLGLIKVLNPAETDERFLYYLFNSSEVRAQIRGSASGTKVRHTSPSRIYDVVARIPATPVQRRIADVLCAYDELIRNCRRRMEILEESARAIYREWFVELRFPGYERHEFKSGPIGKIPATWKLKAVPSCIEINPQVHVPRSGEKPFVPMNSLATNSMVIDCVETRAGSAGSKFQNGDTLLARITPCLENGKTGFVQFLPDKTSVAFGSTEFIVLRSRSLTPEFVYLLARSDEFRALAIKSMSGATGRQRVQENCFGDFLIAEPPPDLLRQFTSTIAPQFRLIHNLHAKARNLEKARKLLLPRLLSGQIQLDAA